MFWRPSPVRPTDKTLSANTSSPRTAGTHEPRREHSQQNHKNKTRARTQTQTPETKTPKPRSRARAFVRELCTRERSRTRASPGERRHQIITHSCDMIYDAERARPLARLNARAHTPQHMFRTCAQCSTNIEACAKMHRAYAGTPCMKYRLNYGRSRRMRREICICWRTPLPPDHI